MLDRWFKCPIDILFDVRFAKLPAGLFRAWAQLTALASLNGGDLPALEQIAFSLHSSPATVAKRLAALADLGLAVLMNGEWRLVERIGRSDSEGDPPLSGAERTRRWRERRAAQDVTSDAIPSDGVTAACDAPREEREEKKTGSSPVAARPKAAAPSGVYISQDAPEWTAWAAWWRQHHGKSPPTDRRGGWLFPALVPPLVPIAAVAA